MRLFILQIVSFKLSIVRKLGRIHWSNLSISDSFFVGQRKKSTCFLLLTNEILKRKVVFTALQYNSFYDLMSNFLISNNKLYLGFHSIAIQFSLPQQLVVLFLGQHLLTRLVHCLRKYKEYLRFSILIKKPHSVHFLV